MIMRSVDNPEKEAGRIRQEIWLWKGYLKCLCQHFSKDEMVFSVTDSNHVKGEPFLA